MLEKPDFPDEKIITCLQAEYGVPVVRIIFLPLGADQNTAVYRAVDEKACPYFVKLRRGAFDEISVTLPGFLRNQGISQVIPPGMTRTGQLWACLDPFTLILYPFIEGHDGYEMDLPDRQWVEFGAALKGIHSAEVPASLRRKIHQENYSSKWRSGLMLFLERIGKDGSDDPLVAELAAFLVPRLDEVHNLIRRTERLAQILQTSPLELTLCHADLHAGNILIGNNGSFHIVDWDAPLLAPKERDLMSIGGGLFGHWRKPREETRLFYQGYGKTYVDPAALAYYRYERIIEDLAVECELITSAAAGDKDRERELRFMKSNFQPGGVLEIARQSDRAPQ